MATGDNAIIPLFEPGHRPTAAVTAAVTSGRFVKISGNIQAGPLLDLSGPTTPLTGGNVLQVALCVAGDKSFGVSAWDAAGVGDILGVLTRGFIVPMVAGAAIVAGVEVQSDANGAAITLAAGKSNGMAVTAAVGALVWVQLY